MRRNGTRLAAVATQQPSVFRFTVTSKEIPMRTMNRVTVSLARNEWGNEVMLHAAEEAFTQYPDADCVTVYEHAGWHLSFDRELRIVGTANDMARMPQHVMDWAAQFDGIETIGRIDRARLVAA